MIIIGGGIAGASLAYFLGERGHGDVLLVEKEAQAAYHSSGRSASSLVEIDPVYTLQQLKMIGGRFLRNPPVGFAENPLLDPIGVVLLFPESHWSAIEQAAPVFAEDGMSLDLLTPAEASARLEGMLVEDQFAGAVALPEDGYVDVHELLSSYIRSARRAGAEVRFNTEVTGICVEGGRCSGVVTPTGTIRARTVVNAAGAWVGEIAASAGATAVEFTPRRRSIVMFAAPEGADTRSWPMLWSDSHNFYFRPDPAGILFCPMDEEPMAPCDPMADDLVIAEGLERLRAVAPRLVPRTLGRRWAGLRTFSPDGVPVVGEDTRLPGFFWLAGQGGCGIETSPAVGRIAADLLLNGATESFDAGLLAPGRFG